MRRFTQLFRELDESNRTGDKESALQAYFREAPAADAVWVLWFFWGNRLSLGIPAKRLRQWAADLSGCPDWLVDACYERVGDLAETASLLLPLAGGDGTDLPLHKVIEDKLLPLKHWDDRFQFQLLREFWLSLTRDEALVLNKMLTGRIGADVSRPLLLKVLSARLGTDPESLAHCLHGDWLPTAEFIDSLANIPPADENPPGKAIPPALTILLEDIRDFRRSEEGKPPLHSACLVMIHAYAGGGGRSVAHSEYALAARDQGRLVPVSKVAAALPEEEIREIDEWIRSNTVARRGPVRTVPAEQVFEIGFEGLRPSSRHKSGLAMRFPRILRWRKDKPVEEIDTVETLRALLS
ncbi:MAG: hypothetical protein AB3N33_02900 [Puniceicoccaceae bacterium]